MIKCTRLVIRFAGAFMLIFGTSSGQAQEKLPQETGRLDRQATRETHKKMCIESGQCDTNGNVLKPPQQETKNTNKKRRNDDDGNDRHKQSNKDGDNQNKASRNDGASVKFQRSF